MQVAVQNGTAEVSQVEIKVKVREHQGMMGEEAGTGIR